MWCSWDFHDTKLMTEHKIHLLVYHSSLLADIQAAPWSYRSPIMARFFCTFGSEEYRTAKGFKTVGEGIGWGEGCICMIQNPNLALLITNQCFEFSTFKMHPSNYMPARILSLLAWIARKDLSAILNRALGWDLKCTQPYNLNSKNLTTRFAGRSGWV